MSEEREDEAVAGRGRGRLVCALVGALVGCGAVWAGSHAGATWAGYAAGAALGALLGLALGPKLVEWVLELFSWLV